MRIALTWRSPRYRRIRVDPHIGHQRDRGIVMLSTAVSKTAAHLVAAQGNPGLLSRWAPLPVRIIVGFGFMMHGYAKFSRGPESFALILKAIGISMPAVLAWMTTLVELIGGFAIFVGEFLRLDGKFTDGRCAFDGSFHDPPALWLFFRETSRGRAERREVRARRIDEIILRYLAGLAALALGGAGPFSIDGWRSRRNSKS